MKRKAILAVLVAAMLALTVALAGCGASEKDKEAFVGTWTLETTSDSSVNTLLKQADSLGMKITVELKSDGTEVSSVIGNGTWDLSSSTAGTIKQSGGNLKISMKDGKLVITGSDGDMTFKK